MSANESQLHVHKLAGCGSRPLAHYLKALGVLRLVADQADTEARGFWRGGVFHLVTVLDEDALKRFFLEVYEPTPILSPWNGGSGFFDSDKKDGINPIRVSVSSRFASYREAISQADQALGGRTTKLAKGHEKNAVIESCRKAWRGPAREWIDAAVVLDLIGEPSYPALLGTGGNDGRLDFTNNFMQRLVELLGPSADSDDEQQVSPTASSALIAALWGSDAPVRGSGAIGQFSPQATSGANGSSSFSGGIGLNPWDYVLMLEGAVLLGAGLSRRAESAGLGKAIAPFAFRSVAVGYGNATESDAGPRGEQWMPLWKAAASIAEVRQLFREARVVVNGKPAKDGIQMARAIAQRGVDRRLVGFERYGFMERNGQANLAVPLGRVGVPRDVSPHQMLVEEVADWVDRLRQAGRDKLAPAAIARSARLAGDALFACTQADAAGAGSVFRHLLLTLVEGEAQLVCSPRFSGDAKRKLRPLSQSNGRALSNRWIQVIHSGLPEKDYTAFRLALALSQQHACDGAGKRWPIRSHWLPLDQSGRWFERSESGLAMGAEQAAAGRSLERGLAAVMRRRRLKMGSVKPGLLPLGLSHPEIGATLADVVAFLAGEVDDVQTLSLARGLMAVDAKGWRNDSMSSDVSWEGTDLSIYGVLRLAMPAPGMQLETSVGSGSVRAAGAILAQLEAGQTDRAIDTACRRLAACGRRVSFRVAVASPRMGHRLAASLAFPLRPSGLRRLEKQVLVAEQAAM